MLMGSYLQLVEIETGEITMRKLMQVEEVFDFAILRSNELLIANSEGVEIRSIPKQKCHKS